MALEFREIPINDYHGPKRRKVFFVFENDRSKVDNGFSKLNGNIQELVLDLICQLATRTEKFNSPKIRYSFVGFPKIAELKPDKHNRFFFFTIIDENIIFYEYKEKSGDKLPHKIVKEIDQKREYYEKEFKKKHF